MPFTIIAVHLIRSINFGGVFYVGWYRRGGLARFIQLGVN